MMFRSPIAIAYLTLALTLARPHEASAWQAPSDAPDAPRLSLDEQTVELVPAEQIVTEAAPPAEEASPAATPDSAVPAANVSPSVDTSQLKATVFKGVEPGHTSEEELRKQWGEPRETKPGSNGTILSFAIEPFPQIDATTHESHVAALVVHLAEPLAPATVVDQLGLGGIATVDVLDRSGRKIGDHFPERGVTLVASQSDAEKIGRVLIEPLRAESFLLRVKRDRAHRWQRNLSDLDIALRLDQRDHRAWWLKAETLAEAGDDAAAAIAIERATALAANVPNYQLTAARLAAKTGKFDAAIAHTRGVLDNKASAPLLQARAALQLGDLLAESPEHPYDKALTMHQRAIKLALPLATARQAELRRAAKHTLLEAHLAIADDIARGRWQKKETIVPQWLARARAIADELIASDQGDAVALLDIGCRSLASYTWLEGQIDPTPAIQQVQADARKFCADCDDALFTQCVSWKLAKALVDAVDTERARKNSEKALAYGSAAEEHLAKLIAAECRLNEAEYQLARLCFLLGSIEAVQRNDHAAAVKWFDKAIDRLARPEPDTDLAATAQRGDWLVSMGLSYWELGNRTQGLKLTELGSKLIELSNREGVIGEEALAVPYHNLAFMHKAAGDGDRAQQFAQLAAQIKAAKDEKR